MSKSYKAGRFVMICFSIGESVEVESGYLQVVIADERQNVVAFLALRNVFFYPFQGVERRRVALVDVSVAFGNVVDTLFRHLLVSQYKCVDTVIAYRVVGHDSVWRNVAVDAASTFDQNPLSYLAPFVDECV